MEGAPDRLDDRVYDLAKKVSGLSASMSGVIEDMRALKSQIWLVVTAALVGPVVGAVMTHFWK